MGGGSIELHDVATTPRTDPDMTTGIPQNPPKSRKFRQGPGTLCSPWSRWTTGSVQV